MKPSCLHLFLIIFVAGSLIPTSAQTTSERFRQADQELNQVYQQLRGSMNSLEKIQLRNAQRNWIAKRDTLVAKSPDKESTLCTITDSRVKELRLLLGELREFDHPNSPGKNPEGNPEWMTHILNGPCALPNLGHGYHMVKLKNGSFRSRKEGVSLSHVVSGTMEGKPVAVGVLSLSTGGSGIFTFLMLYEKEGTKALPVGAFSLCDRAEIRFLAIRNGRVYLQYKDPQETDSERHVLARSDFDSLGNDMK